MAQIDGFFKLMNEKGCEATEEGKARLRDVVLECVKHYEPEGRIIQSGDKALFREVGDKQKHFRIRVIPALITLGFAAKDEKGVVSWVDDLSMWAALGKPRTSHKAPVLSIVRGQAA